MKPFSSLIKHLGALALALAAARGAGALPSEAPSGPGAKEGQERRPVPSREFTVRVDSKENPAIRTLWVSRDGGGTWRRASEAGVAEAWGGWADGQVRCTVRVPEDGAWDLFPQLGDALGNLSPEPRPGQAADPRLRLLVKEPVRAPRLAWDEPAAPAQWQGAQTVTLKWHAVDPDFRDRSAELQYSVEGGPWIPVTRGLDVTGSWSWAVPNLDTNQLRLRVRALSRDGAEAAAVAGPVSVRRGPRPEIARARALYDRARVLHAQGRAVEARAKYEEALAAWPDFGEVYNDLGALHAEQREPAKALEYFNRARRTWPSDPVPYVNAARMEAEMGLADDALADLRDAVALGLDRQERAAVLAGETLWRLARADMLARNTDRAREACELLVRIRLAARDTSAKARQLLEWTAKRN
jgi:tetratricopeptide (TPR) repeat protein